MFAYILRTSIRNLLRHKSYAIINVAGLATGLAACLIILLFVRHEISYDSFLPDAERIYRLEGTYHYPGREAVPVGTFAGGARDMMIQDFSVIEGAARIDDRPASIIRDGDFFQEVLMYSDPNLFDILRFEFIEGERATSLSEVGNIVLSRDAAEKYLGAGPWLGRTITVRDTFERDHVVSGVFENIPDNSHFNLDVILPMDRRIYGNVAVTPLETWGYLPVYTYFRLSEGADIGGVIDGANAFVDRYVSEALTEAFGMRGSEIYEPRIITLTEVHLESPGQFQLRPRGSWAIVYGFTAVALAILFVAGINFVNLATARSTQRSREVAMRKIAGASRKQLFLQFEAEAVILVMIALVAAALLTWLILPYFSAFSERSLDVALLGDPLNVAGIILLAFTAGVGAGIYPALVLANIRPIRVLGAERHSTMSPSRIRKALVIAQFMASAGLIISTALIYLQTDYAQTVDLGYERDGKFSLQGLAQAEVRDSHEMIKQRISQIPGVSATSLSSFTPGDRDVSALQVRLPDTPEPVLIFYRSVDWDFLPLYGVEAIAGRLFDRNFEADRSVAPEEPPTPENALTINYVINQSAATMLGYDDPEAAIGQVINQMGAENRVDVIVGVIPDIHLKTPLRPNIAEVYVYRPEQMRVLNVSFDPTRAAEIGAAIDSMWKEIYPRVPMVRVFVDEYVSGYFRFEAVQARVMSAFAGLAIFVACLGLFGLASFSAERRSREIGLRKVLGASRADIVLLMLRQFSVPVIIANILSWPLGWMVMREWVLGFHYRIDLVESFSGVAAVAVLTTLIVAWLTVASHVLRVANISPASVLRYE